MITFLKSFITEGLRRLGYNFGSELELFDFVKEHVRQIKFQGEPNRSEFYVDFKNSKERGKYIGALTMEMETLGWKEEKFTLTQNIKVETPLETVTQANERSKPPRYEKGENGIITTRPRGGNSKS